jgi:hypothetical protein
VHLVGFYYKNKAVTLIIACQLVFIVIHDKGAVGFSNGSFEGMMHMHYVSFQTQENYIRSI